LDYFVDSGSLFTIYYHWEVTAVLSPLYMPGGSSILGGGFRCLIPSN